MAVAADVPFLDTVEEVGHVVMGHISPFLVVIVVQAKEDMQGHLKGCHHRVKTPTPPPIR